MRRFRYIYLFLAIGLAGFTTSAEAQAPTPDPIPNFAGTWKLQRTYTMTNASTFSRQEQIEVSQNGLEIKFRHTLIWKGEEAMFDKVYNADGRGEINRLADDKALETISITSIKDRTLITVGFIRKVGSTEKRKASFRSESTLSKDNKTLKVIMVPLAEDAYRQVAEVNYVYKRN